jgi:hypothetical protein
MVGKRSGSWGGDMLSSMMRLVHLQRRAIDETIKDKQTTKISSHQQISHVFSQKRHERYSHSHHTSMDAPQFDKAQQGNNP